MRYRLALAVAAVLVVTILGILAPSAHAASPPSGRVAFERDGDIWIVSTSGANARRLTSSARWETKPAWSPNGNTIAYIKSGPGGDVYNKCVNEIWLMNADGTNKRRVPFALSPVIMPGTTHRRTTYSVDDLAWAPNGRDIAVGASAYSGYPSMADGLFELQVYLIRADGTRQRRVGPLVPGMGVDSLAWRPDGAELLLVPWIRGYGFLEALDLATARYSEPFGDRGMWNAVYSPDGTRIAACVLDGPYYTGSARGGMPSYPRHLAVIHQSTQVELSLSAPDQSASAPIHPSWSPDGEWLATAYGNLDETSDDIILQAVDGSSAQVLVRDGRFPAWRPDATKPLVVLVGGLSSSIENSETAPAGDDWQLVKRRLQAAGFEVYVAATRPGAPANTPPWDIDSESADWRESAARLDRQLVAAGHAGRRLILVGHSMGGLISRVYAETWRIPGSGCRPLGLVQLGTPNKGSEAADLAIGPFQSSAADRLADDAAMALFNAEFPNTEALPIYRIAGAYFPRAAAPATVGRPGLRAIWTAIFALYGTAYNDSVVTVDSVRGGPTAGWRGCSVFKAVHANSKWLSFFRDKAGCVLPRRSGTKGAAAIDERIMDQIIEDVRAVAKGR